MSLIRATDKDNLWRIILAQWVKCGGELRIEIPADWTLLRVWSVVDSLNELCGVLGTREVVWRPLSIDEDGKFVQIEIYQRDD